MEKDMTVRSGRWLDILVFIFFSNIFFFHAFGTVVLWLLLLGLWVLLIRIFDMNHAATRQVKWWGSGIIVLLMALYLTVNSGEKALLILATVLTVMLVSVYNWLKQEQIGGILELGLSGLHMIRVYVSSSWHLFKAFISGTWRGILPVQNVKKEKSPWMRSMVVGLFVGLPIVAWLVMTLTKADPIFASFVRNILSEKLLTELPWRLVLSIVLLLMLIPLLLMRMTKYTSPLGWLVKMNWGREMTVVMGMIVSVLAVFLVVQWPYVFASVVHEPELARFGVATYSEYVQKGFGDLLKVVFMVFGVSWIAFLLNKNQTGKVRQILIGMQGLLGLEFVVFIISIFRRVWLYQSYHGLSLARLYGLALLVLIGGMTVTMALRYVYTQVRWVRVEAAWILFMIVATIGMNMEAIVVKRPPTVNGRVDYVYLARQSSDGREGWLAAYEWASTTLTNSTNKIGVLSRDERRDIFYAGLITRNLTKNYHDLIMQYGSDSEVKDYFRVVISSSQELIHLYPIDGMSSDTLGKLRQREKDLDKVEWLEKVDITPISMIAPTWDYGFPNYKAHQDDQYFYIQESQEKERLVGLDRVLAYDPLRNQVYRWMKQKIGYEKLLELQRQDFGLQRRIAGQADNERDFDIDVSLDSPFLR